MTVISMLLASAIAWTNVGGDNYLGGRKASAGYLQGKVVLVASWSETDAAALKRLDAVWDSYRAKPFALIASYRGANAAAAKEAFAAADYDFYAYANADLTARTPANSKVPYYYVVDAFGEVPYAGTDERKAEEATVQALTDLASPRDAAAWKKLIDFEREILPGRTYNHLLAYQKSKFAKKLSPKEKKALDADIKKMKADAEIVKLAELVEFARLARDYNPKAKRKKVNVTKAKVQAMIKKGEPLKTSANAAVAQEAKNSLADLAYVLAEM